MIATICRTSEHGERSGQCERRTRRVGVWLIGLVLWSAPGLAQSGPIVAVGGGTIGDDIYARTLALGGGPSAIVVVLPQASAVAGAGDGSVARWLTAGAQSASKVAFADRAAARLAIERATIIWMPGGSQSRFMQAIAGTGLADVIRQRQRGGAVVGGTSAGAAVLSAVMITGDSDLKSVTAGKTIAGDGLGVWPEVIVDQHFLRRQRVNRLIAAVLDRPSLVGVGIDEGTAVVVRGSRFDVIGASSALVVDARGASVAAAAAGDVHAGTGLALHVLRAGMSFDLH